MLLVLLRKSMQEIIFIKIAFGGAKIISGPMSAYFYQKRRPPSEDR